MLERRTHGVGLRRSADGRAAPPGRVASTRLATRAPAAARSAWVRTTHRRRSPGPPRGARKPSDDPPPHDGKVGGKPRDAN